MDPILVHGIDDIYEHNGKLVILEAKGGTAALRSSPPRQMSRQWIDKKIDELVARGDPWGKKLLEARSRGQLQGMVVRTKVDANGTVRDPEFALKDFSDIGITAF